MGKGGSSVDTTQLRNIENQQLGYASQAADMAKQNYATGQGMYTNYEQPVLDIYKRILMNPAQTTDPTMNVLMQPALQQSQQAAGAANKSLMNMDLGPVAKMTGQQQIDLSRMSGVQSGVLQSINNMLTQLIGAGQQGTQLMQGGPSGMGVAGQVAGQAGSLEASLVKMEAAAKSSQNAGLAQGLGMLTTLMGTIAGFAVGGPGGAMAGGAAGGLFGKAASTPTNEGYTSGLEGWNTYKQQTSTPGNPFGDVQF